MKAAIVPLDEQFLLLNLRFIRALAAARISGLEFFLMERAFEIHWTAAKLAKRCEPIPFDPDSPQLATLLGVPVGSLYDAWAGLVTKKIVARRDDGLYVINIDFAQWVKLDGKTPLLSEELREDAKSARVDTCGFSDRKVPSRRQRGARLNSDISEQSTDISEQTAENSEQPSIEVHARQKTRKTEEDNTPLPSPPTPEVGEGGGSPSASGREPGRSEPEPAVIAEAVATESFVDEEGRYNWEERRRAIVSAIVDDRFPASDAARVKAWLRDFEPTAMLAAVWYTCDAMKRSRIYSPAGLTRKNAREWCVCPEDMPKVPDDFLAKYLRNAQATGSPRAAVQAAPPEVERPEEALDTSPWGRPTELALWAKAEIAASRAEGRDDAEIVAAMRSAGGWLRSRSEEFGLGSWSDADFEAFSERAASETLRLMEIDRVTPRALRGKAVAPLPEGMATRTPMPDATTTCEGAPRSERAPSTNLEEAVA